MQKYIEAEFNEMKNKNSSTCIQLVCSDPNVADKLAQSIAEKYKKVVDFFFIIIYEYMYMRYI